MTTFRSRTLCAVAFLLWAAATPLAAYADTDACTLLTAAQVGAAVGTPVTAGEHITPTFVKTCTWKPAGDSTVRVVTLYLQTAASYEGGKQLARQMAASSKGASIKSAGVGDDAYYFSAADQPGLLVKKGSIAFKITVYATLPGDKKEAMELTLAKDAVAKL
jgi:hypothetical protein